VIFIGFVLLVGSLGCERIDKVLMDKRWIGMGQRVIGQLVVDVVAPHRLASSKTHRPSHLYGLMTKIELFMAASPVAKADTPHSTLVRTEPSLLLPCPSLAFRHPWFPTLWFRSSWRKDRISD